MQKLKKKLEKRYTIFGMTCSSCEAKVESALMMLPEVNSVVADRESKIGVLELNSEINITRLQDALNKIGNKYTIRETILDSNNEDSDGVDLKNYKPLFVLFVYMFGVSFLVQLTTPSFDVMQWMRHFMAGFFLCFSFFKIINIKGFASSYQMYDILAMRWRAWAYIYPFIELLLGLAYLTRFMPLLTNSIAFVVMSLSLIGVIKSVLNKRKIQCACLGDVFDLPMSTITIIEDALMIIMSGFMLFNALG